MRKKTHTIVPDVAQFLSRDGYFTLSPAVEIRSQSSEAQISARLLAEYVKNITGLKLRVVASLPSAQNIGHILLKEGGGSGDESYSIDAAPLS